MYLGPTATHDQNSEISDIGAGVRSDLLSRANESSQQKIANLGDILDHPELFKNYPELKAIPVFAQTVGDSELASGSWDARKHRVTLEVPNSLHGNTDRREIERQVSATLIHEIQHIIQQREGLPMGSSDGKWMRAAFDEFKRTDEYSMKKGDPAFQQAVASFEAVNLNGKGVVVPGPLKFDEIGAARKVIADQVQTRAYGMYRDDPGEVQARNVASKFLGESPDPAPKRNVRELPHAPTNKLGMVEKLSNAKFAIARATERLKEVLSPMPQRTIYGLAESAGKSVDSTPRALDRDATLTPKIVPGMQHEQNGHQHQAERNTRHTGRIVSVNEQETVQLHGRTEIRHRTADLPTRPVVGATVTIEYRNGVAKISEPTVSRQQGPSRALPTT